MWSDSNRTDLELCWEVLACSIVPDQNDLMSTKLYVARAALMPKEQGYELIWVAER